MLLGVWGPGIALQLALHMQLFGHQFFLWKVLERVLYSVKTGLHSMLTCGRAVLRRRRQWNHRWFSYSNNIYNEFWWIFILATFEDYRVTQCFLPHRPKENSIGFRDKPSHHKSRQLQFHQHIILSELEKIGESHGPSFELAAVVAISWLPNGNRTRWWRKFRRKLQERWVVVMHGWQRESTDAPRAGWSCVFSTGCRGNLNHNCWM